MVYIFQVLLNGLYAVLVGVVSSLITPRIERYLQRRQGKKSPPQDTE